MTSLTNALQNVVASLGVATFATILQARIPAHAAEPALAFGDVYRTAAVVVAIGWCLVWTLRRVQAPTEIEHVRPATAMEPAA